MRATGRRSPAARMPAGLSAAMETKHALPPCQGVYSLRGRPPDVRFTANIGRRPEGLRGRRWANGRRHRRPNLTDATPRLAKRAGPAEQETAGSELSGYCERAGLARFERDLLGQHDVANRKIANGQEAQADLWATVFADLADIRSRSRIDPIAVARIAADHIEIACLRELPPLEGREAMPQQQQRASFGSALGAVSNEQRLCSPHP
jgi:hypothetical protein